MSRPLDARALRDLVLDQGSWISWDAPLDAESETSANRRLAEKIAGAEFVDIPDCGHFSAVEHPDTVARALLSLVKRVQQH